MSENQLAAKIRNNSGRSVNQKLRKSGNIPAILYGPRGNILLEMEEEPTRHQLEKMSGMHELIPIKVLDNSSGDSWTAEVVLREVQKHPYKHFLMHLDFWEIPPKKVQVVRVPIGVKGESPGVKGGGVLQMVVRDIPVNCLPADIPSIIKLDISNLELGDSIRIQDVELPPKVSHSTEENYTIISIVGRAKEEESVAVETSENDEDSQDVSANSGELDTTKDE